MKQNLVGQQFGRWTVLRRDEFTGTGKRPRQHYLCRCSCSAATEKVVCAENLIGGKSQSCGCIAAEINAAAKFLDLSGQRFGRLLVLERATDSAGLRPRTRFLCRCDCDKMVTIHATALRRGLTTSCGCFRSEVLQVIKRTHGHTTGRERSRTYRCWANMLTRIRNPKATGYHRYGGRGLRVCERWLSFENFLQDMGECPRGHSIERVNNRVGYSPKNCIWATSQVQQANKSNNVRLELTGESAIQAEWARRFKVGDSTLSRWIKAGRTMTEIATQVGYIAVPKKPAVSVPNFTPAHLRKLPKSL